MEEISLCLDMAKEMMEKSIYHTIEEFAKIRAGKAMPNMLDSVEVEYYDNMTPLKQMASVSTPDAKQILVKPWEKSQTENIVRAIATAGLGFNPQSDGESIRINIPPLTEERRIEIMKQVKNEAENGKVRIRNGRKEVNEMLRKIENISEDVIRDTENEVQELTKKFSKEIDNLTLAKEQDIMTV